ncbi:MAG TPA: VWA domain-containing protein, partial [Burkholderiaceae bacterium]|nr:VWA domain-containing protein [Burkholderiaceae bacterium]
VFILSDGYDTGSPQLLGEQLRRLQQRAKRVIWLNPLMGRADYAPAAGGMQAAMPHLDLLAPAHNLESLMKIEDMLLRL